MKVLKAFIKPFEAPKRSVKKKFKLILLLIQLSEIHGRKRLSQFVREFQSPFLRHPLLDPACPSPFLNICFPSPLFCSTPFLRRPAPAPYFHPFFLIFQIPPIWESYLKFTSFPSPPFKKKRGRGIQSMVMFHSHDI